MDFTQTNNEDLRITWRINTPGYARVTAWNVVGTRQGCYIIICFVFQTKHIKQFSN